jgi:hypothetical protein
MDKKKLVEFAKSFQKCSNFHEELQEKKIIQKDKKINELIATLSEFKSEYEQIMAKQEDFIRLEKEKM